MILAFAWYRALAQCWFDLLHFGETQMDLDIESPQILWGKDLTLFIFIVHQTLMVLFNVLNLPLQQCKHLCFQGQMAFWNTN